MRFAFWCKASANLQSLVRLETFPAGSDFSRTCALDHLEILEPALSHKLVTNPTPNATVSCGSSIKPEQRK
jgi:hypothetical protein